MTERYKYNTGRADTYVARTHSALMPPTSEDEGYTDDSKSPFVRHGSSTSINSNGSSSRQSLDFTVSEGDKVWIQDGPLHQRASSDLGCSSRLKAMPHVPPNDDYFHTQPNRQYGQFLVRPRTYLRQGQPIRLVGPTIHSWLRRAKRWSSRLGFSRLGRHMIDFARQIGGHAYFPSRPATVLMTITILSLFLASLTKTIFYVLDTDKEPAPWRSHCAMQGAFPHDRADSLEPVNVFMGVFSVDSGYERRNLIRSTWLRHTAVDNAAQFRDLVDAHGLPLHHNAAATVSAKFVIGRPRANHARRIALEMELYNDIIVLDIKENMNMGKSFHYFNWAAENATVPVWKKRQDDDIDPVTGHYRLEMVKPDYIGKADDDSFIMLDELERHLRVAERERLYWGYYVREGYMAGELYVLSRDLVEYIATYQPLRSHTKGAEDQRTAKWMRMYPFGTVNWRTEQCRIYDHPKAGTSYSRGFLFEDEIENIQREAAGISDEAGKKRRNSYYPDSYTTAGVFRRSYKTPMPGMTIAEELEALVEGGGRFNRTWYDPDSLQDEPDNGTRVEPPPSDRMGGSAGNNSLPLPKVQRTIFGDNDASGPPERIPIPEYYMTTKYSDPWADPHLGRRKRGGTIAVHYIKRHEWFLETAAALLGRQAWTVPARQYKPVWHRHADATLPSLSDAPVSGGSPWVDDMGTNMVWTERMRPPLQVLEARQAEHERLEREREMGTVGPGRKIGSEIKPKRVLLHQPADESGQGSVPQHSPSRDKSLSQLKGPDGRPPPQKEEHL